MDSRLFFKVALDFPDEGKILPLSDAAFRCLVEAIAYCRKHLTDGYLARRYAVARWSLEVLRELCDNDPEKPSLIEREEGWYIGDYADMNETAAQVAQRRERNRQAGKQGGLAKAKRVAKRGASKSPSKSVSENLAETETDITLVDLRGRVTLSNAREPRPQCSRHPNGNPTDDPCVGCGRVRKWNEQQAAEAVTEAERAKIERRRAVDACPLCDERGMVETGIDCELARCDHPQVRALTTA